VSEGFFSFFKGNVRVLVIGRAIWTLGASIPNPYFTLYMLALGATPSEVGLVNAFAIIGGTNPWRLFRLCSDWEHNSGPRLTAAFEVLWIWQKLPLMGKHNLLGFAETTV
jgi:hypothetical protein